MARPFKLQDPGEGIHEVEVLEILVEPGQTVIDGDTAFVVESDKAAIELPAPYDGTVAQILTKVGDTVRVGDVLMTIDTGEADPDGPDDSDAAAIAAEPAAAAETAAAPAASPVASPATASGDQSGAKVKAAPTARKLAKEKGVDLAAVPASGSRGHVTRQDVERFAAAPAGADREPAPVEIEPLRSIRKATAKQMAKAWVEIPHVMLQDVVDMTDLERLRRRHAPAVKEQGGQLTLMVFVLKALAGCLRDHPRFNASLDMAREEIQLKREIHVGVALDSARGLIVPVMRDVADKSVFRLACDLKALADRVRGGTAGPADLRGATFTLTNIGALGGRGFFPIINPPEVAILGLGRGAVEPVVTSDIDQPVALAARYRVPVSISFDHRVNDGADAARFLADLKARLADAGWFALHG